MYETEGLWVQRVVRGKLSTFSRQNAQDEFNESFNETWSALKTIYKVMKKNIYYTLSI